METKEQRVTKATEDYLKAVIEDMKVKDLYVKTALKVKQSHYKVQEAKKFMDNTIKDESEFITEK